MSIQESGKAKNATVRRHQRRRSTGWGAGMRMHELPSVVQAKNRHWHVFSIFTARCTLVQSAVLRSDIVRLSVRV